MNVQALFERRNRHVWEIEEELRQWRAIGLTAVALALLMGGVLLGQVSGCAREDGAPEAAAYEHSELD